MLRKDVSLHLVTGPITKKLRAPIALPSYWNCLNLICQHALDYDKYLVIDELCVLLVQNNCCIATFIPY